MLTILFNQYAIEGGIGGGKKRNVVLDDKNEEEEILAIIMAFLNIWHR